MNKDSFNNIMLLTDSYKVSHYKQLPPKTTKIVSYFESRGGMFDYTMLFGLQYQLKKYLCGPVITAEKIREAKDFINAHMGPNTFNEDMWNYILEKHSGYLPLVIKATPEGLPIPNHNVLVTVENTDPQCASLTNYVETLLVQNWYGSTVATMSREIKKIIAQYLERTADNPNGLDFKLHDFGFRGVSSVESAAIGGTAHLLNFKGSDTMAALMLARHFYKEEMAAFSVNASEHSTITSYGKEGELEAYTNLLEQFPTGILACVSDSYDIYNACENLWGKELKDKVLNRDGILVIRPDSGIPEIVVPKVLEVLGKAFGYELNSKGYKMLNPKVRVIQGDGINILSVSKILNAVTSLEWSADNLTFGMGGALLQQVNRDTQNFAFKCCAAKVDGKWRDVYKQPIDMPMKKSKAGRMTLVKTSDGKFKTVSLEESLYLLKNGASEVLQEVYKNGLLRKEYTLAECRENAKL